MQRLLVRACIVFCLATKAFAADELSFLPEQIEFFESKVRPLLVQHCYECHSGKSEILQGGFRLDGREHAIRGGDSGAAIVAGKPQESLLLQAVRWESLEMPPAGKLKPAEIAVLEEWIKHGVPWPADAKSGESPDANAAANGYDWEKWRREHWAFQPVSKPTPPNVADGAWVKTDIDRFVLARLEQAGLKPAPAVEPRVLARRIYFDLIGLPPTPAQVEEFVSACQRDHAAAVRELVDRLLESKHYGERWARHWLDVARYSDGHGGFLDGAAHANAWRYRDWVVDAFNNDMPFDKFIRLQIAGDVIGDRRDAVATGFFALGPAYNSDGGDPESVAQAKAETLSDRLDTLSRGMLGLTLACARCHDHKFDPLPQQDYYSLAGVFNNTNSAESPLAAPEMVEAYNARQREIAEIDQKAKTLRGELEQAKREPGEQERQQLDAWAKAAAELRRTAPPPFAVAQVLHESGSADMHVAIRGDLRKTGEAAPRRFLRILAGEQAQRFDAGSGRKQLAEAVADAKNPLTGRVFVNRVWMHHFGEALVRTPSNFGALGERPTHPELLDWLAATFVESGQSLKSLHRAIISSAAYQMSSTFDEDAFRADGDNRLIWRMNPRRLDVEAWRDALLSVTGELDLRVGGEPTDQIASNRRTLYFKVSRNGDVFKTDEFVRLFDFPIMRATVDRRPTSVVPQQFLFLLNSPFMIERSKILAARLIHAGSNDDERIRVAYSWLYQRAATDAELAIGREFLSATENSGPLPPLAQYAQMLLGSNEFMYVQ